MSLVTLRIVLCTSFSVSRSIVSPSSLVPTAYARSKNRRTPWMPLVCHGFTCSSGPMNISKRRKLVAVLLEEAPIDGARERPHGIAARLEVLERGQHDRQLALVDGDGLIVADLVRVAAARIARRLDGKVDRNGLAPVALAREDP